MNKSSCNHVIQPSVALSLFFCFFFVCLYLYKTCQRSTCRKYEDENGCSRMVYFNCTTAEKGDKSVSSTEVLLQLEPNKCVSDIIKKVASADGGIKTEPVRAMLSDVTTSDMRSKFRCYFWGDVSCLASIV